MDDSLPDLNVLNSIEGYSAHFMDVNLWSPVIKYIFRERSATVVDIQAGTAGTFPTFIIDRKYVIKFFGRLFDGWHSFMIESAVNNLLAGAGCQPAIPAPCVIESGQVFPGDDTWRFILFQYLPGQSYRDDFEKISHPDRMAIAFQIGKMLQTLHNLPTPQSLASFFPTDTGGYHARLKSWFQARSANPQPASSSGLGLPDRLASQAANFLSRWNEDSPNPSPLHLIHADVTQDHILGDFSQGHWRINGVIDFGDCMSGNLYYELAPLHLDFFDCDKSLLTKFMEGYQTAAYLPANFARKCLCAALQHQFNVFSPVFERHPELAEIDSLDQLAITLYQPD